MATTETSNKLWEGYFGNATVAKDAFGRKITKGQYGDTNSSTGWTMDHIWPLNPDDENAGEGANTWGNVQPLHVDSNEEKADRLIGMVNDIEFAVKRTAKLNTGKKEGRMKVRINGEWDWAYDLPSY